MPESTSSTIETEAASLTDSIATSGTEALRSVEEGLETVSHGIWEVFHEHPNVGGVMCGGLGLWGAMAIGVAELGAALVAGYIGYRMFAYEESFTESIEKTIEFRQGTLPEEEL